MKVLLAVSLATIYGLTLRISFGLLQGGLEIMSLTFMVLVPTLIGFITIALMPKTKTRSVTAAFFLPWLTSLVILVVTILTNLEGTICWLMIFPFFAILAGIGGVIAYYMQKRDKQYTREEDEEWFNAKKLNTSLALALPLLVGFVEGDKTLNTKNYLLSESIEIAAPASTVWQVLTHINTIGAGESHSLFSKVIGFPGHVETTLDTPAVGGKRVALYEKGLRFDETILAYEPEQKMVLRIHTDPANIPPTVMDEHILIGGKHVAVLEDTYTLEKTGVNSCRLHLSSKFFINTPFNWYAGVWAKYLMGDILASELKLVAARATGSE